MIKLRLEVKSPTRLDLLLLEHLRGDHPQLSRGTLKEWFKSGKVRWNERAVAPSMILADGKHEILIIESGDAPLAIQAAQPSVKGAFLPVIFEDEDLLILHKPSGVPSVPHSASETDTAVNAALAHRPELAAVGAHPLEPGLLHRLDTGTSGLLVFAKSREEFDRLKQAWKTPEIRKFYRAICASCSNTPTDIPTRFPHAIDWHLAHDQKSARRMIALKTPEELGRGWYRGKALPAHTEILSLREQANGIVELKVEIHTGVMHQIRCHLAAHGLPILGDPIYGGAPSPRLMLHAERLTLKLRSGVKIELKATLPSDWQCA